MRYSLKFILFLVVFSPLAVTRADSQIPVIMVLGDSLSAAPGVPHEKNWVALLRQRLNKNGHPHKVVNASVSGDTTLAGLSRLPLALRTHNPSIVIVELGGNDGLRGLPLMQMKSNLEQIITLSRQANARVLLCGVRIPPNLGQAYVSRFLEVFHSTAREQQVNFVPYILKNVAGKPELMLSDGIHPNEEGQTIVLGNVWAELSQML